MEGGMAKNELFIIAPETVAAISDQEMNNTVSGLKEMGLFKLPYEKIDVQVAIHAPTLEKQKELKLEALSRSDGEKEFVILATEPSEHTTLRFCGLQVDGIYEYSIYEEHPPKWKYYLEKASYKDKIKDYSFDEDGTIVTLKASQIQLPQRVVNILITLLATKNVKKTVREHKLARLGIGPKHGEKSYPRVTTISLPDELTASKQSEPTGRMVCAHLRRGHIRCQSYGPRNAFYKMIWIEPVFVNADPDFVSDRKAYNVSLFNLTGALDDTSALRHGRPAQAGSESSRVT
jgi:hypothetical protein